MLQGTIDYIVTEDLLHPRTIQPAYLLFDLVVSICLKLLPPLGKRTTGPSPFLGRGISFGTLIQPPHQCTERRTAPQKGVTHRWPPKKGCLCVSTH
jgi:hypothetical protein